MTDRRRVWFCYLLATASPLLATVVTLSVFELVCRFAPVPPAVPFELTLRGNGILAPIAAALAVTLAGRPRPIARLPLTAAFALFAHVAADVLTVGGMAALYRP